MANMSLTCSEGSLKVTIGEKTLGWERYVLRKGLIRVSPEEYLANLGLLERSMEPSGQGYLEKPNQGGFEEEKTTMLREEV